jgi:outer membrane protein insertion porin family
MILGDLPPYEAFPIGGTNSVRGYSEGGVGSGRNYVAGTAALQWPLYGPLEVGGLDILLATEVQGITAQPGKLLQGQGQSQEFLGKDCSCMWCLHPCMRTQPLTEPPL